ncbi:hypothetical protein AB6O49_03205 [Streptomyces sp. SBR177]
MRLVHPPGAVLPGRRPPRLHAVHGATTDGPLAGVPLDVPGLVESAAR